MGNTSRREFLTQLGALLGAGGVALAGGTALLWPARPRAADGNLDMCFDGKCGRKIFGETLPHDKVARYWNELPGGAVHCALCPYNCVLMDGERCRCQAKENHQGTLYDMVYGYVATMHLDSVEKLPVYHRFPGLTTLALGTAGCGLHCKYCQNWQLSQVPPEKTENYRLLPDEVIGLARQNGAAGIALAYTEPLTFFEYACDIAKAARKAGLKVFMGTGGFAMPDPAREIAKLVDGVAFGLKGFTDEFYGDVVGPGVRLEHILASLEAFKSAGAHIEVANLIVPTKNDAESDIRALARYVKQTLGSETPLHFLKFFPHFQLKQLPPTGQRILETAEAIAREEGLAYTYIGNLPGHRANNTYCPHCGALVVQRIGFRVLAVNIDDHGNCPNCVKPVAGIFTPRHISR
ncbi:AmmeMemoRadiSam system radical SAM enzyme [bacterium]|nr:AmmeMemoRadiSam system radical SAM enzyme [bacterium]